MGGVVGVLDDGEAHKLIKNLLQENNEKFSILAINAILKGAKEKVKNNSCGEDLSHYLISRSEREQSFMSENAIIGLGKLLLGVGEELENRQEILQELAKCMAKTTTKSPDSRRLALVVTRTVARHNYEFVQPNMDVLVPAIFGCVRDTVIPVKLAAEKAYLTILRLPEESADDPPTPTFESWINQVKEDQSIPSQQLRSIQDYTRRVGMRLANSERERIDAGGDEETVFSDRIEDEMEIWAVGGIESESV